MKAQVQYNDFTGTAAADISDHTSLKKILENKGVDTKRYFPIGASFYAGYSDSFYASFICKDTEIKDESLSLVEFEFNDPLSQKDFFELFKRFNVVINKYPEYSEYEIQKTINI